MNEQEANIGQAAIESLTLEQLSQLEIAVRSTTIYASGNVDLARALRRLPEKQLIQSSMDVDRLSWAVAFNVTGEIESQAATAPRSRRGATGYRDLWPPRTLWSKVWNALTKPFDSGAAAVHSSSAPLCELALSVACEQRADWQPLTGHEFSVEAANCAFEELYSRERAKVAGAIRKSFRAVDAEDISDEAWVRAFSNYWSGRAKRRFLGICRISTLLISIARKVAADEVRERRVIDRDLGRNSSNKDEHARSLPEELADNWSLSDPAARLLFKECMARLSPRERIVAEIVWFKGISQSRVAQIMGTTEAYISQVLKSAKQKMITCVTFKAQA